MHRIKEILESRSGAGYYLECDEGNRIEQLSRARAQAKSIEVQMLDDDDLLDELEMGVGSDRCRMVLREMQVVQLPLSLNQRMQLQEMVVSSVEESVRKELAKSLGCNKYPSCMLCPLGQDVVAHEVWSYMTGEYD